MPGEGDGGSGGGGGGGTGGGDGGAGPDAGAILAYLNYQNWFSKDGDYAGNAGYYGDNIGPVGSTVPDPADTRSEALLRTLMESPLRLPSALQRPGNRTASPGVSGSDGRTDMASSSLRAFVDADVDVYSGLPLSMEHPDPFTGLLAADPFADTESLPRARTMAPVAALRKASLLSSPYLLADNDVIACAPNRTSCLPNVKSDFNQSSLVNTMQAKMDESYVAGQNVLEGKAKIIGNTEHDMQNVGEMAAQVARSDDYKLGYAVNQLRSHPLEVRHSAALTGLGHMASGGIMMVGSGLIIYGTGGLALPLIGGMGFAAGTAEAASGFALAISGADSTETVRMSGQLDYIFALTKSPTSLMFGTTGLVLSDGDVGVSHRFALVGGIAEDMATFRGDPSKLYSAVIPGVATKAEKGTSALLVKDVAALGFTARTGSIEQVASKLNREFTVDDLKAIAAFREELASSGRLDLAGRAGHAAADAAGAGGGADYFRHGAFMQELKLHGPNTWIASWYMDKASTQSLNYSIKYQLETRALGEQLVPLRSVKHIWISPTEAVRFVGQ